MTTGGPRVSLGLMRELARAQDLSLSDEQLERLMPLVQALWDGVQSLNDLDLTGLEPAPVFSARWDRIIDG